MRGPGEAASITFHLILIHMHSEGALQGNPPESGINALLLIKLRRREEASISDAATAVRDAIELVDYKRAPLLLT